MKLNEYHAILTPKLLLVPYSEHHVPTYHEWMQDEELQKATASDPLTLPEEYAMQKSWRNDADKLTFIVCTAPSSASQSPSNPSPSSPSPASSTSPSTSLRPSNPSLKLVPGIQDSPDSMIGDINLFLYPSDEEPDENDDPKPAPILGELEIMIARPTHQGRGLGRAVLLTFLWYIFNTVDDIVAEYHASHGAGHPSSKLEYLRVKIDADNARSIRLFESAGFVRVSETPNYFGELEFRRGVDGDIRGVEYDMEVGGVPMIVEYASR